MQTTSEDVQAVYALTEQRLKESGLYQYDWGAMRNAMQVFRYALREWAEGKRKERVLAAVMHSEALPKKIKFGVITHEVVICDDEEKAQIIKELLSGNAED